MNARIKSQSWYHLEYEGKLPKTEELSSDNFIWLPLESIPIDEHYQINSMAQPALKTFPLITWTAIAPCATSEQKFLQKLALEHEEMGYFLLHYKDIFGIIGVEEYHDGWTPGKAVVFNCIDDEYGENEDGPMLDLVYSSLKYPCKTLKYTPGEFTNYNTIHFESYHGPEGLDD